MEADHWKTSHLPKPVYSSMWNEHYCGPVSTGIRPPPSSKKSPTYLSGAGVKVAPEHGNLYGPHSQMLQWHAPFYCTALASRHARKGANANKLVSNAQPPANVKAGARITRAVMTSNTCCEHDRLKSRAYTYMTLMLNKPGFIN
jgi:hypothetical protein